MVHHKSHCGRFIHLHIINFPIVVIMPQLVKCINIGCVHQLVNYNRGDLRSVWLIRISVVWGVREKLLFEEYKWIDKLKSTREVSFWGTRVRVPAEICTDNYFLRYASGRVLFEKLQENLQVEDHEELARFCNLSHHISSFFCNFVFVSISKLWSGPKG